MNKFKNWIIFGLVLVCLFAFSPIANGQNIKIFIDDKECAFTPAPFIQKGVTLVPMRAIFEQLGATVDWDARTGTVTASKEDKIVSLTIGEEVAYLNGKPISLAIKAQTVNGRTVVPLRFVSESLGAKVGWDSKTWTITISTSTDEDAVQASDEQSSIAIAKKSESVALITTFDSKDQPYVLGSGFVIREDGLIVTNYHVIDGASSATVSFENGQEYKVEHVNYYNKDRDVAVLKIKASGLPALKLGDSSKLVNGEKVIAIGNPQGLQNTISDGIVSSANRVIGDYKFIQHTAPLSTGSSGGPLFNMRGEVVGINTAVAIDSQNLNLSIPINEVSSNFGSTSKTELSQLRKPSKTYSMSDQKFADHLDQNFGTVNIKGNVITAREVTTVTLPEGVICFSLMFDESNVLPLLQAGGDGGFDDLEDWLVDMATEASYNYPEGEVMITLLFQDVFTEYPSIFSSENISMTPDGEWLVTWIAGSAYVYDGKVMGVEFYDV